MDLLNFDVIQSLYDELKEEQARRCSLLREKKDKIREIDIYLDGLLDKEESDLQVFLPRKVEDVFHSEIEQSNTEKEKLLAECSELEKQLHSHEKKLEQLEKFLSESFMLHVKQFSILDAQEKERQRIARDLHDTSLQNLTYLVHKVELGSLYIDQDPVKAKLELATVEKGIRQVIEEIRNTIFDLRPMSVDDLGLKETIDKLLAVLNQDKQFYIKTDIDTIMDMSSDPTSQLMFMSIYRIIQECVQNAIKHSDGKEIYVQLKDCGSCYRIVVRDDGRGFDVDSAMKKERHFGLSVIKERVMFLEGKMDIDVNNGTSIEIEIPKKTGGENKGS